MIIFPVSFAKGRMLLLENDTLIKIFSNLGLFTSVTDEVVTARKNLFVIFTVIKLLLKFSSRCFELEV